MPSPLAKVVPSDGGYSVRRFCPADAPGVVDCVRQVYGDSYLHPELYHPKRMIRMNETGEQVSVVALDAAGKVIGHYALERPDLGPIAEEGEALVAPDQRHHHLAEAMRALLEEEANRLGLVGVFGQAVTNLVFSQKIQERFGLKPCGVSLGAGPRSLHNVPGPKPQRMSFLIAFKYLTPLTNVVVHVPARHREICGRIYESFGLPVEFRDPQPPKGPGEVIAHFAPELQTAKIRVMRVGADSAAAIAHFSGEFGKSSKAEAVFLELPLAQGGTPALCEIAEKEGFFFCGVGPHFAADGDVLRMQLLHVDLDVDLLLLDSPFAKELAAYISRERNRVGNNSTA
jgi:hypothetical protein